MYLYHSGVVGDSRARVTSFVNSPTLLGRSHEQILVLVAREELGRQVRTSEPLMVIFPLRITELMSKLKEEGYYINLVLEYVGGGDMRDYLLKKGALSEEEALHWLKHLGRFLFFGHFYMRLTYVPRLQPLE